MNKKGLNYSPESNLNRKIFTQRLLGIFFILLGGLGLTNASRISGFFNFTVAFFFGRLNFIIFILLILFGFYLLFQIKYRIKFTYGYIGIALIFITLFALVTYNNLSRLGLVLQDVKIGDFFIYFPKIVDIPLSYPPEVAGGLIGYTFFRVFALVLGPKTDLIMIIVLLVIGSLVSFEPVWRQLSLLVKKMIAKRQAEKAYYDKITEQRPILSPKSSINPLPFNPVMNKIPFQPGQSSGTLRPIEYTKDYKPQAEETNADKPPVQEKPLESFSTPPFETRKERLNVKTLDLKQFNFDAAGSVEQEVKIEELINNPQQTLNEVLGRPTQPSEITFEPSLSSDYLFPPTNLLHDIENLADDFEYNEQVSQQRLQILNQLFEDFNVKAEAVSYTIGPSITSFDIKLDRSTPVSSVSAIIREISLRLQGQSVIFNESVPGKTNPTLEVPNLRPTIVSFKEMLEKINEDPDNKDKIIIPFGKNVYGQAVSLSLDKVINLLIAGTTGSGKSVFMHSIILSLIMRCSPEQLKLLIIDPKRVEMNKYFDIPHLIAPIITRYDEVKNAMELVYKEVNDRYDLFDKYRIDKIENFNKRAKSLHEKPLPRLVVIMDEYADLTDGSVDGVNYGQTISNLTEKIAAISRASGVHLIIATQRPTTKVVTGNLKANIITKVGLLMGSYVDSTTIIGRSGAEQLAGNGDMLVKTPELSKKDELRVQGAFVSSEDIQAVVDYLTANYAPDYDERYLNLKEEITVGSPYSTIIAFDPDYNEIKAHAMTIPYISANYILRTFGGGFNKAKRIITQLQSEGIIALQPDSPQSNKGLRVLVFKGPRPEGEGE